MGNLVQMGPGEQHPELPKMECGILIGAEGETKACGHEAFSKCTTCGSPKCGEHISNVDPSQCTSCCKDVEISVKIVSKHDTDFDFETDETVTRSYQARSIHLGGEHWLNNQAMIALMPDAKLKTGIEYYKQQVKMMEEELLHRKIHKSKAILAANPLARRRPSVTSVITEKRTTTRTKGTKKVKSADDLMTMLAGSGIDAKKLLEMLQTKVAAKNLGITNTGTK